MAGVPLIARSICRCAFALYGFGCHPIRSARDVLDITFHRAQVRRHTKVEHLYIPSFRRGDVGRLEVAVHKVAPVQVVEPLGDLEYIARDTAQLLIQFAERLEN